MHDRYGPPEVWRLEDVPKPVPAENEVLIRIVRGTVNRSDCHTREANASYGPFGQLSRLIFGVRRPRQRILGTEFAGQVEAVGAGVTRFAPGDRVFGNTGFRFGCHAEYRCLAETGRIAKIPNGVGYDLAAAATDGALNSLSCLRAAGPVAGGKMIVYGASGAIGTAGLQLAKVLGADVTAVCAGHGYEVVRSLGPERVIDYEKEDWMNAAGGGYRVIFDAVGKLDFPDCRHLLEPGGSYVFTDGARNLWYALRTSRSDRRVRLLRAGRDPQADVSWLAELMAKGEYRPVVDRSYPMEQVVEAGRYVETRRKVGNVVLEIGRA